MVEVSAARLRNEQEMSCLRRWARHYRVPMLIPGADPVPFPVNSLLPMRVALGATLEEEA